MMQVKVSDDFRVFFLDCLCVCMCVCAHARLFVCVCVCVPSKQQLNIDKWKFFKPIFIYFITFSMCWYL